MDGIMANTDAAAAFRENVVELMRSQGVTQKDLAAALGTSQAGISRILNGSENVTIPRAERVAKFLKVDLGELLKLPQAVS